MASADLLPLQFADLSRFVEYWVRDSNDQRWDQRSRAPMEEIQQFYDATLATRAEDILAHLDHRTRSAQSFRRPKDGLPFACCSRSDRPRLR